MAVSLITGMAVWAHCHLSPTSGHRGAPTSGQNVGCHSLADGNFTSPLPDVRPELKIAMQTNLFSESTW